MDYSDFMRSKQISERWGEAQGAFESGKMSEKVEAIAYYHELLTDFYDYIQYLEAKTFNDAPDMFEKKKLHQENIPAQSTFSLPPTLVAEDITPKVGNPISDEENPWFGFSE